ncbi:MAG: hypothetical protein V3W41_02335 [Planctomycetota bacterium]
MPDPTPTMHEDKDERVRDLVRFLGGAVVLLLLGIALILTWDSLPWSRPKQGYDSTREAQVAVAQAVDALAKAERNTEEERQRAQAEYGSFVEVRLRVHDAQLCIAKKILAEDVGSYFEERKRGIPAYGEAALTWRNRWTATWDADEYQRVLDRLLAEHVVTADTMNQALTKHVEQYLATVAIEEAALLRDIRRKINELPTLGLAVDLDEEAFEHLIEEHLARLTSNVSGSSKTAAVVGGLGMVAALAATFAGPAIVANGLGGSALARHLGPLVVKWLLAEVQTLIDEMVITEDEVESSALRLLDTLKRVVMKGDAEPWRVYRALEKRADEDPDEELRKNAEEIMFRMKNKGYLGLLAILDLIQERNLAMKAEILGKIGVQL